MRNWLCLVFCSFAGTLWAGAPVDLSRIPEEIEKPKERPLSENDFVFTDPAISDKKIGEDLGRIKVSVSARSLPGRGGKELFVANAGDAVKIAQLSKNKRWIAIYSLKLRRKAWVPLNSVEMPQKKKPQE